jgi:hypothetical protein
MMEPLTSDGPYGNFALPDRLTRIKQRWMRRAIFLRLLPKPSTLHRGATVSGETLIENQEEQTVIDHTRTSQGGSPSVKKQLLSGRPYFLDIAHEP